MGSTGESTTQIKEETVMNEGRLKPPTRDEILASAILAWARVSVLEAALNDIARVGQVGVWPAWEMRQMAEEALTRAQKGEE